MDEGLQKIIEQSSRIVFLGGAGVSTESGIPDFRSEKGLYHAKQVYGYSPEMILSGQFYRKNPELFFKYYKENLIYPDVLPNDAHKALAKLEKEGKLIAVITQNIDGLHQAAGSETVYELHGSIHRNYCEHCGRFHDLKYIMNESNCHTRVPLCECGGRIKPDVVLFGEALNGSTIEAAVEAIMQADTLIIGGTSLAVYPAAGLINYFRGKTLVLINKSTTPYDSKADLVISDSIGKVMKY